MLSLLPQLRKLTSHPVLATRPLVRQHLQRGEGGGGYQVTAGLSTLNRMWRAPGQPMKCHSGLQQRTTKLLSSTSQLCQQQHDGRLKQPTKPDNIERDSTPRSTETRIGRRRGLAKTGGRGSGHEGYAVSARAASKANVEERRRTPPEKTQRRPSPLHPQPGASLALSSATLPLEADESCFFRGALRNGNSQQKHESDLPQRTKAAEEPPGPELKGDAANERYPPRFQDLAENAEFYEDGMLLPESVPATFFRRHIYDRFKKVAYRDPLSAWDFLQSANAARHADAPLYPQPWAALIKACAQQSPADTIDLCEHIFDTYQHAVRSTFSASSNANALLRGWSLSSAHRLCELEIAQAYALAGCTQQATSMATRAVGKYLSHGEAASDAARQSPQRNRKTYALTTFLPAVGLEASAVAGDSIAAARYFQQIPHNYVSVMHFELLLKSIANGVGGVSVGAGQYFPSIARMTSPTAESEATLLNAPRHQLNQMHRDVLSLPAAPSSRAYTAASEGVDSACKAVISGRDGQTTRSSWNGGLQGDDARDSTLELMLLPSLWTAQSENTGHDGEDAGLRDALRPHSRCIAVPFLVDCDSDPPHALAEKVVRLMAMNGLTPSPACLAALLATLDTAGMSPDEVVGAIDRILVDAPHVDGALVASAMNVFLKAGLPRHALDILAEHEDSRAVRGSYAVWEQQLGVALQTNDVELAGSLHHGLRACGMKPTAAIRNQLLSLHAWNGDVAATDDLFASFRAEGYVPSWHDWQARIVARALSGRPQECSDLLHEAVSGYQRGLHRFSSTTGRPLPPGLHGCLLATCWAYRLVGDPSGCEGVINLVHSNRFLGSVSRSLYQCLLSTYAMLPSTTKVDEVVARMQSHGLAPTPHTYDIVMSAYGKALDAGRGEALIQRLEHLHERACSVNGASSASSASSADDQPASPEADVATAKSTGGVLMEGDGERYEAGSPDVGARPESTWLGGEDARVSAASESESAEEVVWHHPIRPQWYAEVMKMYVEQHDDAGAWNWLEHAASKRQTTLELFKHFVVVVARTRGVHDANDLLKRLEADLANSSTASLDTMPLDTHGLLGQTHRQPVASADTMPQEAQGRGSAADEEHAAVRRGAATSGSLLLPQLNQKPTEARIPLMCYHEIITRLVQEGSMVEAENVLSRAMRYACKDESFILASQPSSTGGHFTGSGSVPRLVHAVGGAETMQCITSYDLDPLFDVITSGYMAEHDTEKIKQLHARRRVLHGKDRRRAIE